VHFELLAGGEFRTTGGALETLRLLVRLLLVRSITLSVVRMSIWSSPSIGGMRGRMPVAMKMLSASRRSTRTL